jgi:hypothetical protein
MIAAFMVIHRINIIGVPNRLLVLLYNLWAVAVAWQIVAQALACKSRVPGASCKTRLKHYRWGLF